MQKEEQPKPVKEKSEGKRRISKYRYLELQRSHETRADLPRTAFRRATKRYPWILEEVAATQSEIDLLTGTQVTTDACNSRLMLPTKRKV